MLGRATDLIAFERLGVVDGDGDAAVIRGEVAQRRVQERIADEELAVVRHVLERDRHHIRHTGGAGGQIPHVFFEQFLHVFVEHDAFLLLWFLSLSSGSQTTQEKQDIRKFMSDS